MKAIKFKEANCVFANQQPEYIPLPAFRQLDGSMVVSCWELTFKEKVRLFFGAKIYWAQLTFRQPLQPCKPSLDFSDFFEDPKSETPLKG